MSNRRVMGAIFSVYCQCLYSRSVKCNTHYHHHILGSFLETFIISHHWNQSWARWIYFTTYDLPSHFYKINFNTILSSIFSLNLPKGFFLLGVSKELCVHFWTLTQKLLSVITAIFIRTHLTGKHSLSLSTPSVFLHWWSPTFYKELWLVNKLTHLHVVGDEADGIMKLL
jgi:hypothetical protein